MKQSDQKICRKMIGYCDDITDMVQNYGNTMGGLSSLEALSICDRHVYIADRRTGQPPLPGGDG